MITRCIFPTELIYQILYHADPRDIVRWRTVSKWFRTITYDGMLWKALHANAPSPCPPGSFPTQSNASLERTLVRSARLAQSWTTWPMRDVSLIEIDLKSRFSAAKPPKLICGRWHLACEMGRQIVLYDVDAGAKTHGRRVLWEENAEVFSLDVCPMPSEEGQCVVYVLVKLLHANAMCFYESSYGKLLEFRLNNESGELYDSVAPAFHSLYGELRGGKSPFLVIPGYPKCLVFDTRTRVFYEAPEFRVALDETRWKFIGYEYITMRFKTAFSNTHHIFLCYSSKRFVAGPRTVIQVFTLPPDGPPVENGNPVLRLTHEGVADCQWCSIRSVDVLKPSVNPATGATNVKLLNCCTLSCPYDLGVTLPEPSAVDVLPMTVELQHIGFPKNGMSTSYASDCFQYVDVSDDGHVRGFCRKIPQQHYGYFENPMKSEQIVKFTIDTTQDQWVLACVRPSPAEWNHIKDTWINESITFDGMRGRLCFANRRNSKIVVVDIE